VFDLEIEEPTQKPNGGGGGAHRGYGLPFTPK
jgi:hypothetical protein